MKLIGMLNWMLFVPSIDLDWMYLEVSTNLQETGGRKEMKRRWDRMKWMGIVEGTEEYRLAGCLCEMRLRWMWVIGIGAIDLRR